MKMIKIYHNNRCSKSRQALEIVNTLADEVEIIDYMKDQIGKNDLLQVLDELNMNPQDLLRKNEADQRIEQWLEDVTQTSRLAARLLRLYFGIVQNRG